MISCRQFRFTASHTSTPVRGWASIRAPCRAPDSACQAWPCSQRGADAPFGLRPPVRRTARRRLRERVRVPALQPPARERSDVRQRLGMAGPRSGRVSSTQVPFIVSCTRRFAYVSSRSRLGFAEELRAARRRWHPPAAFIAWPHCRHVGFDQACVARHCAGWTTAFTVRCVSVCLKVLHARACVSSSMAVQSRPRSRCLGRSPVHGRAGWAEVVARSSGRVRYRVRSWRDRARGPGLRHGPGSWPSRG